MPNDRTLLADKIQLLENNLDSIAARDQGFARSLCQNYHTRGLSDKQAYWVGKLLEQIGEVSAGTQTSEDSTEEVFNGHAIRNLLLHARETLRHPKLRYQTDGKSKVVFSVGSVGTKWDTCVFIDNGARAEGKKRYGFISKFGNGKLDRNSPPDIKTLIRRVAQNPSVEAKLQGQKFANCCFCGLDLVNKSSVYHGYGPICAGKWGLPWGDTGDLADEEAAAAEEMKHIQLTDLGPELG